MAGTNNNPIRTAPGSSGNNPGGDLQAQLARLNDQLKQTLSQNDQLRMQLNQIQQQNRPQPQAPQRQQRFEPGIQQAIDQTIDDVLKEKLNEMGNKYKGVIGHLNDQLDEARYHQKYADPKFQDYEPRIQQMRNEYHQKGFYLSREEALKHIYFEDNARKPAPAPRQEAQPTWDKTLNMFVHPGTTKPWFPGQPVDQPPTAPGQPPAQPQPNGQQQPQNFNPNGQQPQYQQQPQNQNGWPVPQAQPTAQPQQPQGFFSTYEENNLQQPNNPVHNNNNSAPRLPDTSPNSFSGTSDPIKDMDITKMTEKDLAAWENNYGDVPL